MTQTAAVDAAPRIAAALAEHPGVVDVYAEESETGGVRVFVVALPGGGRVPAEGRCALIDASGGQVEGILRDVSLAGVRVIVEGDPPDIGTPVQMWIEAEALGAGVDGWLGQVRWVHGQEVGVSFAGNFDEGLPLVRLVRAFAEAADGLPSMPTPVDPRTRARIIRRAVMQVGTLSVEAVATDVSETGLGLRARDSVRLDLRSRDVQIRVEADGLWRVGVHGTVVRHVDAFVAVALRPDRLQQRSLRALVEQTVARPSVALEALEAWIVGRGLARPEEIRLVDAISRR